VAETETDGASNPAPAGEAAEGYPPPTPTLIHSVHAVAETDPAQPAPSTSATATGPAPRNGGTDEGWKKVERKHKGKKGWNGRREASRPRLIKR